MGKNGFGQDVWKQVLEEKKIKIFLFLIRISDVKEEAKYRSPEFRRGLGR